MAGLGLGWRRAGFAGAAAAGLAACSSGNTGIGPLPVSDTVHLAVGEYVLLSGPSVGGTVRFPAADSAGAKYLIVGQFATGTPDLRESVRFGATTLPSVSLAAPAAAVRAAATPALQFHDMLRRREADLARQARLVAAPAPARVRAVPPAPGSQRTFKVCANISCATLKNVVATAAYVGSHAAIFVDDSVPANGFTQADLDEFGAQFDTTLYTVDANAFGAESDIDGNGVVIILLTRQINALVPAPDCNDSFISGYFYGADIAPGFASSYNNGEVFYGFVPDPSGTVSCAYSKALIKHLLPVVFAHEFQHMISFNQKVLVRNGDTEVLWLNEGLSHLAEELVGLHYDSLGVDSTSSRFTIGNLYNAFLYLKAPQAAPMVSDSPPGGLEVRGGTWLFLRYLVDRFGPNLPRQLVQTAQTGSANVAAMTGTSFGTLVGQWALASYASDLPGFVAPAVLRYSTWNFYDTFQSLHQESPGSFDRAFPLIPTSGSSLASVVFTGTISSGSGAYLVMLQTAGAAGFDVALRAGNGSALPAGVSPQLAVLRLR